VQVEAKQRLVTLAGLLRQKLLAARFKAIGGDNDKKQVSSVPYLSCMPRVL
jgi:hypothetical protein